MLRNWISLLISHSLFALTILEVTQHTDDDPGGSGNMGELRYYLNQMNTDLNMGMVDDYAITFETPMTIQLNGILPIINNSSHPVAVTIGNTGSIPTVTIDGNEGAFSGFFLPTGTVTIQNMIFQNMTAKGGNGGNGISGGGGGLGAGGAIYAPQNFLNVSDPSVTLINVTINDCSAIGGDGGRYIDGLSSSEGGGGGGGFSGNGGSITTIGTTGGAGGGGFGGNGGNATTIADDPSLGGGGGGGGLGSRANTAMPGNLGNGGADNGAGGGGSGYGLGVTAGDGGGTYPGGINAGGGGGGNAQGGAMDSGGGGGGSRGDPGQQPKGSTPPGGSGTPSGGNGGDGGGGGGGGVVLTGTMNGFDGEAGSGGYGGGGGGGAGTGASDAGYTVNGGAGGVGGGGGGGGVNQSGMTPANGGNSLGGGGGGGGGPTDGSHGTDTGHLGGGDGGDGAAGGGGGGGGGSGLGGAIFVDSGLNFTIQALSGFSTSFNTSSTTVQAGTGGTGGTGGGTNGANGTALGNSIFLRSGSNLTFTAQDAGDLLTLGDGVSFVDDTAFAPPGGGTNVFVTGNGTVVYEGTSDYQGTVTINNANFKVNGQIEEAHIQVCRNLSFSAQRGTLSGTGTLTGDVFVNSGTISPDIGGTPLTLGSLILSSADPGNTPGSLVHIQINPSAHTLVSVNGTAELAGTLEIELDPSAPTGAYTVLTAGGGITGTFDSVTFTETTPNYSLSYLPIGAPTFVQFNFLGLSNLTLSTQGLSGNNLRVANYLNLLAPNAAAYGLTDQLELLNNLPFQAYENALESISPSRNSISTFAAQNVMFMFSEALDSHFTKRRLGGRVNKNRSVKETALLADNELITANQSPRNTMYAPPQNTHSQIWATGFGQFSHQDAQDQTPAFDFNSGGFFVAYDYGNTDLGCIGALAGYAHSSIDEHHSMGDSHLNSGYLSVYGMRFFSDFFIDAAVWGGFLSVDQKRKISYPGFSETATSSYSAEQLDLHFGTGYDFNIDTLCIEPFGLLDWVFESDPSYTEEGAVPYNMKISSRTSWMLRCETGLNGYKTITYSWGIFIAQAKLSYVYKKPHHVGHLNAAIAGAPSSFFVEAFTAEQSLISPAIELFWQTNWNGYGSISYDGEFGSGYSSNQFYGKIGYSF